MLAPHVSAEGAFEGNTRLFELSRTPAGRFLIGGGGKLGCRWDFKPPGFFTMRVAARRRANSAGAPTTQSTRSNPPQIPHIALCRLGPRALSVRRVGVRGPTWPYGWCFTPGTINVSPPGRGSRELRCVECEAEGEGSGSDEPTQSTHKSLPVFLTSTTRRARKASPNHSRCLLNPLRGIK